MNRIFVTGGTGLAGSAVISALAYQSDVCKITSTFRSESGSFLDHANVRYAQCDLSDVNSVARLASGHQLAILMAGNTGGFLQTTQKPWHQVTNNIVADTVSFQALFDCGIRNVVYLSSATVYPPLSGAISEDRMDWSNAPSERFFGVGWAKRNSEKLAEFWCRQGMNVIALRLSNVYGPGAQFLPENSNVVAALIKRFTDTKGRIQIYGNAYDRRDFLYSSDFGELIVKIVESPFPLGFNVYNVGSGVLQNMEDLAKAIVCASNFNGSYSFDSMIENGPGTDNWLDTKSVKKVYDWTPATSLNSGVLATYSWWKNVCANWQR